MSRFHSVSEYQTTAISGPTKKIRKPASVGLTTETGTPEDMPEDARAGFETTMTLINDLDDDAQQEDFEKIDEDLTEDETAQVDEFDTYTTDTCGSPMDNMEVPEIPTETPSQ